MNTIRVFALAAAMIIAISAQDVSLAPSTFFAYTGESQWVTLYIKNLGAVSITSTSFKVLTGGPISISYPGAGTQTTVGTISAGATGGGQFNVLGGTAGVYSLNFYLKYTKSGVAKTFNQSLAIEIQDPESSSSGAKRMIVDTESESIEVVDDAIVARSDIGARDTYLNIATTGVFANAGDATWSAIQVVTGSVNVNTVTFSVVPSGAVSISYASNSIGSISSNSSAYGNFQHLADCGYYNLNVTVSYKLQGTSTVRKVWKIILLSVTGSSCEGGDTGARRGAIARGDEENNAAKVPVEYAVAVGIAGVALVAVFSVVGTMFFLKRRTQTDVVA